MSDLWTTETCPVSRQERHYNASQALGFSIAFDDAGGAEIRRAPRRDLSERSSPRTCARDRHGKRSGLWAELPDRVALLRNYGFAAAQLRAIAEELDQVLENLCENWKAIHGDYGG